MGKLAELEYFVGWDIACLKDHVSTLHENRRILYAMEIDTGHPPPTPHTTVCAILISVTIPAGCGIPGTSPGLVYGWVTSGCAFVSVE